MGTRFTVITTTPAGDELIALWLAAPAAERLAIPWDAALLGVELRDDAHLKGSPSPTPTEPAMRQLTVYQLRAFITVSAPDRQVWIHGFEWLPSPR